MNESKAYEIIMKKRGLQFFIAITVVLCLLALSFPAAVTATMEGISGSATAEVYNAEPVLIQIVVTPGTATIFVGETQQFKAEGIWSDGRTRDITQEVLWRSTKPDVATIAAGGLATGVAQGLTGIYAVVVGKAGAAVLTVQCGCQIDKENLKKTEADAATLTVGSIGGGALLTIGGLMAGGVPGIILGIGEAGACALAGMSGYCSWAAGKMAGEDPPYIEVFQIRPRTLDPWLPEPTTSFELAGIDFINSELRAIETMEALAFSLERQWDAFSAGDFMYYRLQIQAVLDYSNMLIADLTSLASSSAEFYEEWVKMGITVTPEDFESYQQTLATEGFSEWQLQIYKEGLLLTDEQIEQIKSEILSIDPVTEWEDIESALPELDDVILSTLPAFSGLAGEAERILGCTCCVDGVIEPEFGEECDPAAIPTGCPEGMVCIQCRCYAFEPCVVRDTYGPLSSEVETLRAFRDQYLVTNPVGEALMDLYYKVNPPITEFITEHPVLKPVVKVGLFPAVAIATVATNTNLPQKMAIGSSLLLVSLLLVGGIAKNGGFPGRKRR